MSRGTARSLAWSLVTSGVAAAVVMAVFTVAFEPPWLATFHDVDEGFALVKARLLNDGHAMYTDIWYDQVPLHGLALAAWMRAFGDTLLSARLMTLVIAAAGVVSFWRLVSRGTTNAGGEALAAATAATALLLVSRHWAQHATAAMIGPASLFLGLVALDLAMTAKRTAGKAAFVLAVAAGVVLAVAAMFKLLVVPLAIVTVGATLIGGRRSIALGVTVAAVVVGGGLLIAWQTGVLAHLDQAVGVGAKASADEATGLLPDRLWTSFHGRRLPWLLLAILGTIHGYRRGWRGTWPALAMLAIYEIVLYQHRPFRYHSGLAITLPLSWLGGYGLLGLWEALRVQVFENQPGFDRRRFDRNGVIALLALSGVGLVVLAATHRPDPLDRDLVARLRERPSAMTWSDEPMYLYLANRPIPPWLAIVSKKRIDVDAAFAGRLADTADAAGVEEVVMTRMQPDRVGPAYAAWLAEHFELAWHNDNARVYRRRASAGSTTGDDHMIDPT